jgi:putative membrane protein
VAVGAALVFAGAGSMTAAALVLLLSSPDKRAAALKQGVLPALGVVILAIGLLV